MAKKIEGWVTPKGLTSHRREFIEDLSTVHPSLIVDDATLIIGNERVFTESEVRAIIERLARETYVWTEWKKKHAVQLLKEHGISLDPA
jgi:hypothetical protein